MEYIDTGIIFIANNFPTFFAFLKASISIFMGLSIPFSFALFILIIIFTEKLKSIRKMEDEIYNKKAETTKTNTVPEKTKGGPEIARKWDMVVQHVESENPSNWRQAIIEADIILGDLLTKLGYKGDGIGEQLKRATKADFRSLDEAWDAHKVRNELAHAGSDYPFSQYDARRVVSLYRKVFEEFFFI